MRSFRHIFLASVSNDPHCTNNQTIRVLRSADLSPLGILLFLLCLDRQDDDFALIMRDM